MGKFFLIVIAVVMTSFNYDCFAFQMNSDLDDASSCESCFTDIIFDEGGCIITDSGITLNFIGEGDIYLGDNGYISLGDNGSTSGYDIETGYIEAGGQIVLGENGKIVGDPSGFIQAANGFVLENINNSSVRVIVSEDFFDKCKNDFDEIFNQEPGDSCAEQESYNSGSLIISSGDTEVYTPAPTNQICVGGPNSDIKISPDIGTIELVGAPDQKIEDDEPKTEENNIENSNGGGSISYGFLLFMLLCWRFHTVTRV